METPTKSESATEEILKRLTAVEIDLAVIKSTYATREDIAKLEVRMASMETRLLKWFFATAITLAGLSGSLAFLAAKFIH
jgi:hypothetical protein